MLPFLSLADLIRSKETEREGDWQDIALLEEILDARNFSRYSGDPSTLFNLLADVASRRGMDRAIQERLLENPRVVLDAARQTRHPVTLAFLLPMVPADLELQSLRTIDRAILPKLREAGVGTPKHFALIEICRRDHRRGAVVRDRLDKQARLREQRDSTG